MLRGRGTNRLALATAFATAALALPGTAFGQSGGLIDQYIEDVPTSGGTHHAGGGSGGTGSTGSSAAVTPASLPSDVKTKLEDRGGKDSEILQEIATSQRYGAPPATAGAPSVWLSVLNGSFQAGFPSLAFTQYSRHPLSV